IVMANWTANGFVGLLFRTMARHVSPPRNLASPLLWGDETVVRERLRTGTTELTFARRLYPFHFSYPPRAVVDFHRAHNAPAKRASAALDADGQARLRTELERLWSEHNQETDGSTRYTAEYLEVAAVRG